MKSLIHFAATKESLERRCNRNGDSYVSPHRRLRYRIAERLIRLYNRALGDASWAGCTADHPAWLRDVRRWCGIWPVMPRMLHVGAHIKSCYTKKLVKDENGVWWCETTFTPREWPDLRQLVADNMLRDMALPASFMVPMKDVPVDLMRHRLMLNRPAHIISGGMDPAAPGGDRTSSLTVCFDHHGDTKVFFGDPLGIPCVPAPEGVLPEGVAGMLVYPGSPEKTQVIKATTDQQPAMPLATVSILVLRRSDLLPEHRDSTIWAVRLPHFANPPADFENASHIVFIDGIRQRLLKSRDSSDVPYNKASYFHPNRVEQKVVDGRLITAFPDDDTFSFKAGTLFCEPWTDEDSENVHKGEDAMGVTVTREGRMFHDAGIYIPNP